MPVQITPSAIRLNHASVETCAEGHCHTANGDSNIAPHASVAAATAAGGRPAKYSLTRLADTPYRKAPTVPAVTAGPSPAPPMSPLASTTTPTSPAAKPASRRPPIRSPNIAKAARAANGTAMLLTIAPTPAGARSAVHANSRNGSKVLTKPIAAILNQPVAASWSRARLRDADSTSAPSARRTSTSASGPNFGAEILRNRNEPPQIAASNSNSAGVRQSRPLPGHARGARHAARVPVP